MVNAIQNKVQINTGLKPDSQRLKNVCRQFEALFMSQMLKTMDRAIPRSNLVKHGLDQQIFGEMLLDEYATLISKSGRGVGLAEMLYKNLSGNGLETDPVEQALNQMMRSKLNQAGWLQALKASAGAQAEPQDPADTVARVEKYRNIIKAAAERFGVDENLIKSVIHQESAGRANTVSPAGAKGLMQLLDSTAKAMGIDNIFDAGQNIIGGTRYLRQMLELFGNDEALALAGYNAGPQAVKEYNGVPPFRETREYIKAVQALKKHYAMDQEGRAKNDGQSY